MITAAIWLAWFALHTLWASTAYAPGIAARDRAFFNVLLHCAASAAAILATIAVNR